MDDQDPRLRDLARAAAPGLVDAVTAGILTDLGTANTPAAIAGGFVGLAYALDQASGQRRADRLGRLLEQTAADVGGPDILTKRALATDEHAELLRRVLEAGARTTLNRKVHALAQVLANGLNGNATIDEALALANALSDMEGPHVTVLSLIEKWGRTDPVTCLIDVEPPPELGQRPAMPHTALTARLRGVEGVLDGVTAVLIQHGLIRDQQRAIQGGQGAYVMTPLGVQLLDLLTDHAE